MNDLISIIIPVYNVEDYIRECLDSVTNQSYTNLEIILIDDGSKDSSKSICDEYANNDNRIIVIHKDNEGVSMARNDALKIASGKFVTFVDADDILTVDSINFLYKNIIENNADIAVCGWEDFSDDSVLKKNNKYKKILKKEEVLKSFFQENYFKDVIWGKLYKKDILNKIQFNRELTVGEDVDFLYQVMKKTNKIIVNTNEIVYRYRIRNTSAAHSQYNKSFEKEIIISEKMINDVSNLDISLKKYAIRRYQRVNVSCLAKYYRENKQINDVSYLVDNIKKYNNCLDIKYKVEYFLLLHGKPILKGIFKLMKKM